LFSVCGHFISYLGLKNEELSYVFINSLGFKPQAIEFCGELSAAIPSAARGKLFQFFQLSKFDIS
jgi:hypothetical protein